MPPICLGKSGAFCYRKVIWLEHERMGGEQEKSPHSMTRTEKFLSIMPFRRMLLAVPLIRRWILLVKTFSSCWPDARYESNRMLTKESRFRTFPPFKRLSRTYSCTSCFIKLRSIKEYTPSIKVSSLNALSLDRFTIKL